MNKPKVDCQLSVLKGFKDYKHIENFLSDLRSVMIEHEIEFIASEFIKLNEDKQLIVRKTEFIAHKENDEVKIDDSNRIIS